VCSTGCLVVPRLPRFTSSLAGASRAGLVAEPTRPTCSAWVSASVEPGTASPGGAAAEPAAQEVPRQRARRPVEAHWRCRSTFAGKHQPFSAPWQPDRRGRAPPGGDVDDLVRSQYCKVAIPLTILTLCCGIAWLQLSVLKGRVAGVMSGAGAGGHGAGPGSLPQPTSLDELPNAEKEHALQPRHRHDRHKPFVCLFHTWRVNHGPCLGLACWCAVPVMAAETSRRADEGRQGCQR